MTLSDRLTRYLDTPPTIHASAFVASGAVVIGDVTLAEESSVWFQAVLRGDINRIVIGPRSNVQDGAVVHLADDYGTFVGELVTVGHKAVLHACTISDEVLVGMGAIILDDCEIGAGSIIAAELRLRRSGRNKRWRGNRRAFDHRRGRARHRRDEDSCRLAGPRLAGKSRTHPFARRPSRHQSLGGKIRGALPRVPRAPLTLCHPERSSAVGRWGRNGVEG